MVQLGYGYVGGGGIAVLCVYFFCVFFFLPFCVYSSNFYEKWLCALHPGDRQWCFCIHGMLVLSVVSIV